jgi:hypothetical protein
MLAAQHWPLAGPLSEVLDLSTFHHVGDHAQWTTLAFECVQEQSDLSSPVSSQVPHLPLGEALAGTKA